MEKLEIEKLAWFDKTLAIKFNELIDYTEKLERVIWYLKSEMYGTVEEDKNRTDKINEILNF